MKGLLQKGQVFKCDRFQGTWRVLSTERTGGGTAHGPHDVFPDGHLVTAQRAGGAAQVRFYQTGCFRDMILPEDIELVGDARTRWGHAECADPDEWEGAYETREACVEAGTQRYEGAFWVISGQLLDPAAYVKARPYLMSEVLDIISNEAAEDCGADEELFVARPGAEAALEAAIREWATGYLEPRHWGPPLTHPERVVPAGGSGD